VAAAASTRTKAMRGRFIIQLLLVYDSSLRTGIILPGIAAALWMVTAVSANDHRRINRAATC
jgi:hypothetical protein